MALTSAKLNPSTKSCAVPTPPEIIRGISRLSLIFFEVLTSSPKDVPSLSILQR